ncbi:insulinase family protein [Thalassotalea piscium]|uniref:Protease 3 n=1 Tax=Thalassotalea piscium TaxID=1230533 RepID=A0A7X0NEA2_9GAMM|nr:insulinase family protein [Thalassotalea piscium]MBB6541854.1 secreted Zn-dependent insulinase-like peptidase [Thalassotalea piscium]
MKISPNDHKQYQSLTLANGLRVLLVHNTESAKSAAALAVNVGHFNDPIDRQGLAHFLEHMLFLGTEKYPDGSEYQQFISQYGGCNNAWTATEHTCFFFDIHHQHFEIAIERFGQFFTAPLLSQEFVQKERKNIDAEFKLKLKDEIRRLYDVHKETVNPKHPFAKFSVGNSETLADRENSQLHDEVKAFFEKYYLANAMTLVLEGPQELEQLKTLAITNFSQITAGKIKQPEIMHPLYLAEHLQKIIKVQPVKKDQQLIISFAMPEIHQFYRNKPEATLIYLLGHEGKGSILSLLKEQNLAFALTAGSGIHGSNFKDFNINIRLTEHGQANINLIVSAIFQYLILINPEEIPEYYYQEKKSLAEISFQYHEKSKPIDSVCQLAISMQHYNNQDILYGDYAMDGLDRNGLSYLQSFLKPTNMRLILIGEYRNLDCMSQWYQVPYSVASIESDLIDQWENVTPNDNLYLPTKNPYIVYQPKVLKNEQSNMLLPELISQESGLSLWFKQDVTFKVPKGYIYINIDNPKVLESIENIAMTRLFADLFSDDIVEQFYNAELAGINYSFFSNQGGLTVQLSGLSEKQPTLLKHILARLQAFKCTKQQFELFKLQLLSHWDNGNKNKSISQLFAILSSLLQPSNPSSKLLAKALSDISFERFTTFYQTLFDQVAFEIFMHGNWHKKHALALKETIIKTFTHKFNDINKVKVPVLDITKQKHLQLPLTLPEHDNACVIYFPMPNKSLEITAKTMLISQLLAPDFFQEMRTEKQFGYLVGVSFVPINKYPGLAFYIQSPNIVAEQLQSAIQNFINRSIQVINDFSEDNWQHLVRGLATQLQERDTSLRIKSQRFWASICNEDYTFTRKSQLIQTLLGVTRNDLKNYIITHISLLENTPDYLSLLCNKAPLDINNDKSTDLLHEKLIEITTNCSTKY